MMQEKMWIKYQRQAKTYKNRIPFNMVHQPSVTLIDRHSGLCVYLVMISLFLDKTCKKKRINGEMIDIIVAKKNFIAKQSSKNG